MPERVAAIGRVRNPFAERVVAKITPESLTRLMKMSAELSDQMAFCKLMLRDPQISTCMRNLSMSVSRQEIRVKPFDEKSAVAKKRAVRDAQVFGRPWVKKLIRRLVYGEFFPFAGAELVINDDFTPVGFDIINATRWTWSRQQNQLLIRTLRAPSGEPIPDRRGFIIHTAALEPGDLLEGGFWWKTGWIWLFKWSAYSWLMKFANKFGEPWLWAFFDDIANKDSVLETLTDMSTAARGAFPRGTEINFKEPQRYSTVNIYETIFDRSDSYITKVIQGHTLNTDAQSGTGTLAGNAAADVSDENKAGVSDGITETFQSNVMEPYTEWQDGEKAVENGEVSKFEIVCQPPVNLESKSKTHVLVNQLLQPAKKMIDPAQIEETYDVRTVDLPQGDAPAPANDPGPSEKPKKKAKAKSDATARTSAAAKSARIRTLEDVVAASATFGVAAGRDHSAAILKLARDVAEAGGKHEDFRRQLFEAYDALNHSPLAELTAHGMVIASAIGAADEAVK
jgi:phage gp29-like protein